MHVGKSGYDAILITQKPIAVKAATKSISIEDRNIQESRNNESLNSVTLIGNAMKLTTVIQETVQVVADNKPRYVASSKEIVVNRHDRISSKSRDAAVLATIVKEQV